MLSLSPRSNYLGVTIQKNAVNPHSGVSSHLEKNVTDVKSVNVNSIGVALVDVNHSTLSGIHSEVDDENSPKSNEIAVHHKSNYEKTFKDWLEVWESNPADAAARAYLRLVSVAFAELNTESKKFLSRLDSWQLQEEGRTEWKYPVAQCVWQTYLENTNTSGLHDSHITRLYPLPPAIVELSLAARALKEVSGDLSQLTLLSLIDCRNVEKWSAKLSPELKIDGNLDRVSPLIKSELEDRVRAELSEYPAQTAITAAATNNVSVVQNYRQKYPRSCGAASLLAVARHISCSKNPVLAKVLAKYPILCAVSHFCAGNSNLQFFYEKDIYKITSGYQGDVADLQNARGSLPHKMTEAAKLLGLEPTMYVNPANHYGTAIINDPGCLDVKNELAQQSIAINEFIPSALKPNEFEIRLLAYVDKGEQRVPGLLDETTHWVVFMSDGSLMDPSIGRTYANLGERNAHNSYMPVADSGISIRFK